MEEKLTFEIEENGKKVKCEELYTFKNEQTNKNYMIYTDNTQDEDGCLKIYASIYEEGTKKLIPITDDDEWDMVLETFNTLEEND